MTQEELEREIAAIKERNWRVEVDKAWELSWTRRLLIGALIYLIAGIWLKLIEDTHPWLKAFVPSVGYVLSTLSITFVKSHWQKKRQ